MKLFQSINKRKSTRKYNMQPLDEKTLSEINTFIDNTTPLFEGIETYMEICSKNDIKNLVPFKAPHYLTIYSENSDHYLMNIGFIYQQIDLFLSSINLGSCWLGLARPSTKKKNNIISPISRKNLKFVIIISFGKSTSNPHRKLDEFKRKSIGEISSGKDPRLEYARLAPSSTNSQPWYFICGKGNIYVYRQNLNLNKLGESNKLGSIKTFMYDKMNQIDIGIALSHIFIASKHLGLNFNFSTEKNNIIEAPKGYEYIGIIK